MSDFQRCACHGRAIRRPQITLNAGLQSDLETKVGKSDVYATEDFVLRQLDEPLSIQKDFAQVDGSVSYSSPDER